MSRGLGKLQNGILEALHSAQGPILRNQLMWMLAEDTGALRECKVQAGGMTGTRVKVSFESSFQRSLAKVADTHLSISARKIQSFEELVRYFPYKTSWLDVKNLRFRLLPHLQEFCDSHDEGRFSAAHIENHTIRTRLHEEYKAMGKIRDDWYQLERKIISYVGALDTREQLAHGLWLDVIYRGRQLFLKTVLDSGTISLGGMLGKIKKKSMKNDLEKKLFEDVVDFYWTTFPKTILDFSNFKSKLYTAVSMEKMSKPHLKNRFKVFLLKKDQNFISSLPEHSEEVLSDNWVLPDERIKYSPKLNCLIDRLAFSKFEFLSLQ